MLAALRSEVVRDSSVRKGVDCKRNGDGRIVAGEYSSGPQLDFLTRWGGRWPGQDRGELVLPNVSALLDSEHLEHWHGAKW